MGHLIYFLSLNLTRIAELRKEDLAKHIRKRTIQTGRLFFSSSFTVFKEFFGEESFQKKYRQECLCYDKKPNFISEIRLIFH